MSPSRQVAGLVVRTFRAAPSAALALVVALAAPALVSGQQGPEPGDPLGRPPDGLLDRPRLQALVDAQVERRAGPLRAALADPDPVIRARAAFGLGSVQDPAAVPDLLAALEDPDTRVRADAAFALGQSADSTASEQLLEALSRETASAVRRELFAALGKTGSPASLRRLTGLTVAPGERTALALAMGRYGLRGIHDSTAVRRLVAMLPGGLDEALGPPETVAVSGAAAWYFGRARDTTRWGSVAAELRRALDARFLAQSSRPSGMGGGGIPAPGEGPGPALHLLAAVGRLADPQDDERLVDWLEGAHDWRARVEAARALAGRTDREPVRRALLATVGDAWVHVAMEAARTLSAADSLPLETQRAISHRFLGGALPWQVSAALAPAMVRSGAAGAVLLVLSGITGDQAVANAPYRADLLEALGPDGNRPGWVMLRFEAGAEDPRVAAAAVGGLAERWRRGYRSDEASVAEYYRLFAAALERRDLATTSAAAAPLADPAFRPLGATRLLSRTYEELSAPRDIEPMVEILAALGRTGDPDAEPALREALAAPHPVLRQAAASALEELLGDPVEVSRVVGPAERRVDWPFLRAMGSRPRLALDTERGRVVVELETEQAPLTVQTVLQLAQAGRYDGTPFHRVVPDFVAQGGDVGRGDGYGGPGYTIRSEFARMTFGRGVIGIASAGKDTEGSQFFLTHSAQPHLDGRYTAFGRVVQGMDVVDRILEGELVERAAIQVRSDPAAGGSP